MASPPPSTSLSACASSRPTSTLEPSTDGNLHSAQKIGVASGPPAPASLPPKYWTVLQRNNIQIPPLKESKWVTAGVLGTGGFGRVYHVYNVERHMPCAMKVVRFAWGISESACFGIINELKVLSLLASEKEKEDCSPFLLQPCIANGLWAWRSSKGSLHILTDVCGGGTLSRYRLRVPYQNMTLACAEIILGLNWLHEHGIVHHDLKPDNILIDGRGHCVIADYGGARFLDKRRKLTRDTETAAIVTKAFAAPEILTQLEEGEVREYNQAVDYWSLGVTATAMFLDENYLPEAASPSFLEFRLKRIKSEMHNKGLSEEFQEFVMDLLCIDPAQRCTYPAITKHQVFQSTNWLDVEHQVQSPFFVLNYYPVDAHGRSFYTPKVHKSSEANADFLAELQAQRLSLEVDDSYDLESHHADISGHLSGRIVRAI